MSDTSIDFYNDALDALQAGNAPEALAAAVNSLTEDPKDPQTWQLYIVILNALGRSDDAARATAKLKELGISPADEHLMHAAQCVSSGDLTAAIPHYRAALEAEPDRVEIHTGLSLALMKSGDAAAALAAADTATALAPEDAHAHYARGHVLRITEQKDAALAALTRAVELDPTLTIALYEQGMILVENNELESALQNFRTVLKHHPADPGAQEAIQNITARMNGGFESTSR